jgi:hypothetical protein
MIGAGVGVGLRDFRPRQGPPTLAAIQRLFTVNEPRCFFDFSSIAEMRQESNGTGAAATNAPVGYLADFSGKGNNAIQATTANKPTLRITPLTGRYWLESIDASRALNLTFATAPGNMHVGRVTPEGVVWSTENWSATTRNLLGGTGSYSAGVIARKTPFTAREMALVNAYFARQLPILGQERVPNGAFNADITGWLPRNLDPSTSVLAWHPTQKMSVTANGVNNRNGYTSFTAVPGSYYFASLEINRISGISTAQMSVDTSTSFNSPLISIFSSESSAVIKGCFAASQASLLFAAWVTTNSNVFYFDNASVREIL